METGHEVQNDCVVCQLRIKTEASADRPYFSCEGEAISFGELWARGGQAAAQLQAQGLGAGDLVAGLAYNSVSYLVLLHGCLRLGAVFAPLNPSLQWDEIVQTLARIRPRLLVISDEMSGQHKERLPDLGGHDTVPLLEDMTNSPKGEVEAESGQVPEYHWKAGEWSWVIFSGATTGLPKAIMLPHGFAMAHARRIVDAIQLTPDDKWLSNLQMCHAWLDFVVMGGCLMVGAHCCATRWFSASRWLTQVREFDATVVDPFLPMASALVAQRPTAFDRNHNVRVSPGAWGTVGEWERRMAFEDRFGIRTVNCFGITEAGGLTAAENLDLPRRRGSTGKPTSDFEIMIADEEGHSVESGQHGEVLYRPTRPSVIALGYLGDAERTLTTWRDLWIHSGDIGYADDDGYIYFVGRMPHWLRRKGENVSVRDVEMAIRQIPGVADAAVMAVPSTLGDDDIKALVVLGSDVQLSPAELHAQLTQRLAFFKVPRFIEIVDGFPQTIKSEPDRKRLQAIGLTGNEWDAEAQRSRPR